MGDPRCNRRYSTLNGRAVNERRKKLALRPPQKWALFAVKRPRLKRSAINKRRGEIQFSNSYLLRVEEGGAAMKLVCLPVIFKMLHSF